MHRNKIRGLNYSFKCKKKSTECLLSISMACPKIKHNDSTEINTKSKKSQNQT